MAFFIWAKEIYLYSIRGQYGRELILFKKAPQQGIQINAQLAGGPSIGLKTPYYIEVTSGTFRSEKVPYKAGEYNFDQILGTGNLFQGLFESSVTVGLNVKSSLSFEFGAFKSNVSKKFCCLSHCFYNLLLWVPPLIIYDHSILPAK